MAWFFLFFAPIFLFGSLGSMVYAELSHQTGDPGAGVIAALMLPMFVGSLVRVGFWGRLRLTREALEVRRLIGSSRRLRIADVDDVSWDGLALRVRCAGKEIVLHSPRPLAIGGLVWFALRHRDEPAVQNIVAELDPSAKSAASAPNRRTFRLSDGTTLSDRGFVFKFPEAWLYVPVMIASHYKGLPGVYSVYRTLNLGEVPPDTLPIEPLFAALIRSLPLETVARLARSVGGTLHPHGQPVAAGDAVATLDN